MVNFSKNVENVASRDWCRKPFATNQSSGGLLYPYFLTLSRLMYIWEDFSFLPFFLNHEGVVVQVSTIAALFLHASSKVWILFFLGKEHYVHQVCAGLRTQCHPHVLPRLVSCDGRGGRWVVYKDMVLGVRYRPPVGVSIIPAVLIWVPPLCCSSEQHFSGVWRLFD